MIVELQGVSLTYQAPDGEVKALDNVSFGVNEGEFVSIVGPSGCGKSTLLSIMAGLEKPTGGSALLNGQPISSPSPKIGYMPQKDQLFPWRTIWGNITLGPELQKIKSGPCIDHINDLCRRYGIADFIKKTDFIEDAVQLGEYKKDNQILLQKIDELISDNKILIKRIEELEKDNKCFVKLFGNIYVKNK